jgi:dihydropteroate synthase
MIMGILNATPDSFSDGGVFNSVDKAMVHIDEMVGNGAQIIDIGGESTRPGSDFVTIEEERQRVIPILEKLPKDKFLISIDSNKIEIQKEALEKGAHIINDVMGGSEELFALAEEFQCGLVLMHTSSVPKDMQNHTNYKDVIGDINDYFNSRFKCLNKYKIPKVWMDPGIGFGKTLDQNLDLMKNMNRFKNENWGLLLGTSRKSWIPKLLGEVPVENRLAASLVSVIAGWKQGVDIFRVHDVLETKQALDTASVLLGVE